MEHLNNWLQFAYFNFRIFFVFLILTIFMEAWERTGWYNFFAFLSYTTFILMIVSGVIGFFQVMMSDE